MWAMSSRKLRGCQPKCCMRRRGRIAALWLATLSAHLAVQATLPDVDSAVLSSELNPRRLQEVEGAGGCGVLEMGGPPPCGRGVSLTHP